MLKLEWQGSGLRCRANRGFDIFPTGDLSPHPHAVKALWQGISRDVSVRENAGTASWRKHGKCQRGGMLPSMRLSGPDQAMSALHCAFFHLDVMAFNGDQGYIMIYVACLKPPNSIQIQ